MPETVQSFSKCHNIGKHRALDSSREEGIAPKQFPRKSALRNEWGSWEKKTTHTDHPCILDRRKTA